MVSLLLAEDNPGDVFLVREALKQERLDHELVIQGDGEQMLQYIHQIDSGRVTCPDLVLLDLNLPKANGAALLARVRQSPVCGHVPVVIVTSSDAVKDREATARLGASTYFRKPTDYDGFMKLGPIIRNLMA